MWIVIFSIVAMVILFALALCKVASKESRYEDIVDEGDGCTPDREDE